jgi:hypothetical protein
MVVHTKTFRNLNNLSLSENPANAVGCMYNRNPTTKEEMKIGCRTIETK